MYLHSLRCTSKWPQALETAMVLGHELSEAIDSYVEADVITEELKAVTFERALEALNAKKTELLDIVVHLEEVMCDASNPTGRRPRA